MPSLSDLETLLASLFANGAQNGMVVDLTPEFVLNLGSVEYRS